MKEYLVTVKLTKIMEAEITVEAASEAEACSMIDESPYQHGEPDINEGTIETIDWEVESVEEIE